MRSLAPFGLFLLVHAAGAQSWCPPGATWVYDTGCLWVTDAQTMYVYTGDTVVDGYPAQRISSWTRSTFLNSGSITESGPSNYFSRTDGDVVWEWNGAAWDTLYWFSAVPGDRWQPFWPFGEDCPGHAWHVIDTATVILDGVPLRRVWVELLDNDEPTGSGEVFTERIGGGGGAIFPGHPPCGPIIECFNIFSCYRDDEVYSSSNCTLTLGLARPNLVAPSITLHPNPGTTFQLSGLGQRPALLRVLDVQGRTVRKGILATEHAPVDLGELRPGIYLVEAQLADGRREVLRWVKE